MIKLRPHHLLDIATDFGNDRPFAPHPYGHAYHAVAKKIIAESNQIIELVLEADSVCAPCRNLQRNGQCRDILSQISLPISKQRYNDQLDQKLFVFFDLKPGNRISSKKFLRLAMEKIVVLAEICTHPGEQLASRIQGLESGFKKLGIK